MKTKLTLTVKKSIIDRAKRYSKKTGKSISRMFEELFVKAELATTKSDSQLAAERLLKILDSSEPVQTLDDKALLKEHIAAKYA